MTLMGDSFNIKRYDCLNCNSIYLSFMGSGFHQSGDLFFYPFQCVCMLLRILSLLSFHLSVEEETYTYCHVNWVVYYTTTFNWEPQSASVGLPESGGGTITMYNGSCGPSSAWRSLRQVGTAFPSLKSHSVCISSVSHANVNRCEVSSVIDCWHILFTIFLCNMHASFVLNTAKIYAPPLLSLNVIW